MRNSLIQSLGKPPLYTKTKGEFWNDEHISRQMLKAHLDPENDGASRNLKFIETSAAWIKEIVPPDDFSSLLDIGCGPGIYAERFCQQGYQVTGIDFSRRSIDYAKQSASEQGLDITYLYQNYLDMALDKAFDFATMIYCDYGALSTADRKKLMRKVYQHLKPRAKFLLDVFSVETYNLFQEKQTWELCSHGGFWREDAYIALSGNYKYPDSVTLEQTIIITDTDVTAYYLWNTCFTKETLINEAKENGFNVCGVFGNVAGEPCHKDSPTLAILLGK